MEKKTENIRCYTIFCIPPTPIHPTTPENPTVLSLIKGTKRADIYRVLKRAPGAKCFIKVKVAALAETQSFTNISPGKNSQRPWITLGGRPAGSWIFFPIQCYCDSRRSSGGGESRTLKGSAVPPATWTASAL